MFNNEIYNVCCFWFFRFYFLSITLSGWWRTITGTIFSILRCYSAYTSLLINENKLYHLWRRIFQHHRNRHRHHQQLSWSSKTIEAMRVIYSSNWTHKIVTYTRSITRWYSYTLEFEQFWSQQQLATRRPEFLLNNQQSKTTGIVKESDKYSTDWVWKSGKNRHGSRIIPTRDVVLVSVRGGSADWKLVGINLHAFAICRLVQQQLNWRW